MFGRKKKIKKYDQLVKKQDIVNSSLKKIFVKN